jgi:hypothetical protein
MTDEGGSYKYVLQSIPGLPKNRAATNSTMPIVATSQTSERTSGTPEG